MRISDVPHSVWDHREPGSQHHQDSRIHLSAIVCHGDGTDLCCGGGRGGALGCDALSSASEWMGARNLCADIRCSCALYVWVL